MTGSTRPERRTVYCSVATACLARQARDLRHDYLLQRAPHIGRRNVEKRLQAFATRQANRDALRRFNQVLTIAGEYDAYIEHALKDVDDATNSRGEVIRAQIFKGLLFASLPLSLVSPPFAVVLGGYFVLAPLHAAVIAHVKGDTSLALRHWLQASWGLLGLMTVLPGMSFKAMGALMSDARRVAAIKHMPLEGTLRVPSMRFDRRWAIQHRPGQLQKVTEPGIWQGTYRSGEASEALGIEHFVLNRGRYFKVVKDVERDTLRVVKANRLGSFHQEAIVRSADGRWVANSTGLRGGNPVEDVGRISALRSIGLGEHPNEVRGALQGEAVVGRFVADAPDNYLFTLNAQTCVAVSLYCPVTRAGAVIHFDHNIQALIERAIRDILPRIRRARGDEVRAVMAGGDWLGGANIGEPIRSVLRRQGVSAQWDHWSYSSCFGNTYGMTLDLNMGVTRVYTTSTDLVQRLYDPILRGARAGAAGMPGRAHQFMRRARAEPLFQASSGRVINSAGRSFRPAEYEHNAIVIHLMS